MMQPASAPDSCVGSDGTPSKRQRVSNVSSDASVDFPVTSPLQIPDDAMIRIMQYVDWDDGTHRKCNRLLCRPTEWMNKDYDSKRPLVIRVDDTTIEYITFYASSSLQLDRHERPEFDVFDADGNRLQCTYSPSSYDPRVSIELIPAIGDGEVRWVRIYPVARPLTRISYLESGNALETNCGGICIMSLGTVGLRSLIYLLSGNIGPCTLAGLLTGDGYTAPLEHVDVSSITNMTGMFFRNAKFNQPLARWNMSNVTSTRYMFYDAKTFNQPIGSWDVSSAETMSCMFSGANAFNQDIAGWNVARVERADEIFDRASALNPSYQPKFGVHWK